MKKDNNIGVLGSGQLCSLFAKTAIQQGYKVFSYSTTSKNPAQKVGVVQFVGEYDNFEMVEKFLNQISYLTFEFENIPIELLNFIELYSKRNKIRVLPDSNSIKIAQNKFKEKQFFQSLGLPTVRFHLISSFEDYEKYKPEIRFPCVLKRNTFGYDGKGQIKFNDSESLNKFLSLQQNYDFCIEEFLSFDKEISLILARFENKTLIHYLPIENFHKEHILIHSLYPAKLNDHVKNTIYNYSKKVIHALDYIGVIGIEFFVKGENVFLNEFAPRPHNSGHFSIDACELSQFDLQLRTLLNLSDPDRVVTRYSLMRNIIGEEFYSLEKQKKHFFQKSNYNFFIYGKEEVRTKRKMGHWNFISDKTLDFDDIREIFPESMF